MPPVNLDAQALSYEGESKLLQQHRRSTLTIMTVAVSARTRLPDAWQPMKAKKARSRKKVQ